MSLTCARECAEDRWICGVGGGSFFFLSSFLDHVHDGQFACSRTRAWGASDLEYTRNVLEPGAGLEFAC